MKCLFLSFVQLSFVCINSISLLGQTGFTVNISLQNFEGANKNLRLIYKKGDQQITDSVYIYKSGIAQFIGNVSDPEVAILQVYNKELGIKFSGGRTVMNPYLTFILTNEKIEISGDAKNIHLAKVKGGQFNTEWNGIKHIEQKEDHKRWLESKLQLAKFDDRIDTVAVHKELGIINSLLKSKSSEKSEMEFIQGNPSSFLSLYFIKKRMSSMELQEFAALFNSLGDDYKKTNLGSEILQRLTNLINTQNGKDAFLFKLKGKDGIIIDLASFKGKFVLLDFWGSWCGPCRRLSPTLKRLYDTYSSNGFEIISISQEVLKDSVAARKAWLKAIETDKLNWSHILNNETRIVIDLIYQYSIAYYPTWILLDRELRIMGRFDGTESDIQKIEETIKN